MKAATRTLKRIWSPADSAFGGRRSVRQFSYEAFLPDAIATLDPALPSDVANVVTEAEVAVRALNGNPPRLGALESLARQLLRAEAVASSRIEGVVLGHRRLARAAFDPEEADATAREVLGNIRAMEEAIAIGATARKLAVADLIAIHRALLGQTGLRAIAGTLRTTQNWIGGSDDSPRGAEFVPPPEDRVAPLLSDLCAFMARDDIPAVAQAAIAHAQFETIHPFPDGNGRVGRCLVQVLLRRRGLARDFVPPISLVLASDQAAYIRGLTTYRAYTADALSSWVAIFAQATRSAAHGAERLADRMSTLVQKLRARAGVQRAGSTVDRLIGHLAAEPVLTIPRAAELTGATYESARLAVEQLVQTGVLSSISAKRWGRLYEARSLFDLVDDLEHELSPKVTRKGKAAT